MEYYRQLVERTGEWRWLLWGVFGMVAVSLGVWLFNQIWKRVVVPVTNRTRTKLDQVMAQNVRRPLLSLIFAGGLTLVFSAVVNEASRKADAAADRARAVAQAAAGGECGGDRGYGAVRGAVPPLQSSVQLRHRRGRQAGRGREWEVLCASCGKPLPADLLT